MVKRVREVMSKDPITIDPEAPIATAIAVMRDKGVRHLPVVDDAGRLLGVISDRDLRDAVFAPAFAEHLSLVARRRLRGLSATLEGLRVKDVMTWDAVTTKPEAALAQAAAVMFEGRFGSLPVVEKDELVGIITERDVLRALAETLPSVRGIDPDTYLW
ncbi:MAG: CBS domain-containing protein [Candidatus Rokubacteria bacterium]|nr:CBS domain-containing protein [Candidatus Rokubacteria bacterium]